MAVISDSADFTIDATPAQCMELLLDIEDLPNWSSVHKRVTIEETDDQGRASLVFSEGSIAGISDKSQLKYSWTDNSCSWVQAGPSMAVASHHGSYTITPAETGTGAQVHVELMVEPKIPLPGFVVSRARKIAISGVTKDFTKAVLARASED